MTRQIILLTILGLLFTACGPSEPIQPTPDVNAIHTAAAQTVVAEFTQTALAAPTITPEPTATEEPTATPDAALPIPTATVAVDLTGATVTPIPCDDANFDPNTVDVTFPDRTEVTPGQDFVKTWKIKNTGTCTWGTGYSVIFAFGEKMSGVAEPLTTAIAPGEEIDVSVRFKAPDKAGEYNSTWRMANANSSPFGEQFYVLIVVR
ncbi:MAG: NBR1-Ig-like domain-containing protein [Chloroflexota bacterium]